MSSLPSASVKRFVPLVCVPVAALAQNPVVPVLNVLIPDKEKAAAEEQFTVVLGDHFGTEEINDNAVRLTAEWKYLDESPGMTHFDFLLFRDRTPVTTENFLGYVNRGDYVNMVIHRWVTDFVLQGGGFTIVEGADGPEFDSVPTQSPIVNEFGVSNTLGTISMAKLGGNPDSATSQWFVSTGANSDNLDFQNGGFTVFGRVSQGTMQSVMDLNNGVEFSQFNLGGAFAGTPLVTGTTNETFTADRFFRFSSATEIPLPEGQAGTDTTLTYSIVSQLGGGSVSGAIVDDQLMVDFADWPVSGRRVFEVQAEDSVGNQVVDTFKVEDFADFQEWRESQFEGDDLLDDAVSGPQADPNGDGVTNLSLFVCGLPATGDQRGKISLPSLNFELFSTQIRLETAIGLTGIDFVLEQSGDLNNWSNVEGVNPSIQEDGERDVVVFNVASTPGANESTYYRIRFAESAP